MKLSDDSIAAMSLLGIPDYMHGGLIRFYENGIPPGDFLSAVINNDLKEAFGRADSTNQYYIRSYLKWLYNHAPAGTWGYPDAVKTWCENFEKASDR